MIYIVEALLVQGKVQYGWAELSNLDVLCEGSHLLRKSSGQKEEAPVTPVATITGGGASAPLQFYTVRAPRPAIIRQDISVESKLSRWGPTEICRNSLRDKICEEAVIIYRAATGGRVDDPQVPPQPSSCQTLKSVISI
ncbi:Uncharacterized protein BM_BM8164 [Brugia malayi]|uniref:Bm12933 n=1 Tax=Brugia malayi TaxID=6279 RepID=A0A1P6CCZ5_BRUMA|nr:Uncharacterized protein BM_BM8164 [Brugia malayi]CDP91163.1 Bm8164 [Brugia malayi]CDQ02637.1 Bm12933 [Brugia malayi]CDQ06639.1 Bm8345 [Brugia malayi]VIO96639.1 Uncharacterized protein BM_BM8164 [Brugia malayi]